MVLSSSIRPGMGVAGRICSRCLSRGRARTSLEETARPISLSRSMGVETGGKICYGCFSDDGVAGQTGASVRDLVTGEQPSDLVTEEQNLQKCSYISKMMVQKMMAHGPSIFSGKLTSKAATSGHIKSCGFQHSYVQELDEKVNEALVPCNTKLNIKLLQQDHIKSKWLYSPKKMTQGPSVFSRNMTSNAASSGHMEPCKINIGDVEQLVKRINEAVVQCKTDLNVKLLKQEYSKSVRPHLTPTCLITPGALHHSSTQLVAFQFYLKHRRDPEFISSYELMVHKRGIADEEEWNNFMTNILSNRIFVVEDWTKCNIANIETLHYDYGIKESPGSTEFYKGEADASYNEAEGKATLCIIIWKGTDCIWSEVYRDVICPSIIAAESYAALALLFKCLELQILNLLMCTDNRAVYEAVTGALTLRLANSDHDILLLLKHMRKSFRKLISMWKPRELMFFADDLSKNPAPQLAEEALQKWSYHLSGKAIFKISQASEATNIINNFVFKENINYAGETFFMMVEHENKVDALAKVMETLKPSMVYVAIDRLKEKPHQFQCQIKELFGGRHVTHHKVGYTMMQFVTGYLSSKDLLVVLDATLPKQSYQHTGLFTIIFVAPQERKRHLEKGMKELNALAHVYFDGVRDGVVQQNGNGSEGKEQLKWKDWKQQQSRGK